MNPEQKTFRCTLIDPTGTLLDCRSTSVVFPAHDGQIGVLVDHMPMLCQLGLGTLRVTVATGAHDGPSQAEVSFFIDGGFALVASNSVTLTAYDALALRDVRLEKVESMIEKADRTLTAATVSAGQREHERERLRALRRIVESLRA